MGMQLILYIQGSPKIFAYFILKIGLSSSDPAHSIREVCGSDFIEEYRKLMKRKKI